ncbi:MAG TPA: hypothetical protein VF267_05395, partial [Gammaproteobacteria bacterium]
TSIFIGFVFSMLAISSPLAAPSDVYKVSLQVLKQSVVVSNPTIETAVGKEAMMTLTGLGNGNDYKMHVKIEKIVVENGDKVADVALNFFEKQNGEWKLVVSPKLTSKIGSLTQFSISEPNSLSTQPDIGFRLQITPVDSPLDIALSSMSDDDDVSAQMKCVSCSSGATMCCSNGCCSDSWNGCPRICD